MDSGWLHETLRILIAAVFASAAIAKILSFQRFSDYLAQSVGRQWLLSRLRRNALAAAIISTEMVLAAAVGTRSGRSYAAIAMVVLVYCFSGFLATQYLRRNPRQCKCWGEFGAETQSSRNDDRIEPQDSSTAARGLLMPVSQAVRNTTLCATGIYVAGDGTNSNPSNMFWALPILLMFAISLIVSALIERRRLQHQIHPRYYALAKILAPLVILDYYRTAPAAGSEG